ncbi:MAG: 8-oxoguanine deaminase [Spirochaetaceae bacterium]|nr:MAG: 8-oxoguanine deaminase [Spirochaetaceae bacterium]
MSTLLAKNISVLVTMDEARREIPEGAIFVRDNVIESVGTLAEMPVREADVVLDLSRHVVIPGLVNTHHHMYQSLTRVIAQDNELFDWLVTLYPIWARLRGRDIAVSTQLAMAELILSGCTTTSDHHYVFPNDVTLDHQIEGARRIGMRFHAARGSMSLGESRGGLPPDSIVEDEEAILRDTRRVIEEYHDPSRYSMLRIVVAPCSPFSVTADLMRESAALARSYGVHLHTHLAENERDIEFTREVFSRRPGEYAEDMGWLGDDVWHAHCVKVNDQEIRQFAGTRTGVCHCPSSNMRLASGIAPIRRMIDAGVPVGLGVDGSASNDSGNLLGEARQAMLLQRAGGNPAGLRVREALELATRGGAAVLGRDDIGAISPGMGADFVAYRTDTLSLAGTHHDPVAALVLCTPGPVDVSVINGRVVVQDGNLSTLELPLLVETHNSISRSLIRGR